MCESDGGEGLGGSLRWRRCEVEEKSWRGWVVGMEGLG